MYLGTNLLLIPLVLDWSYIVSVCMYSQNINVSVSLAWSVPVIFACVRAITASICKGQYITDLHCTQLCCLSSICLSSCKYILRTYKERCTHGLLCMHSVTITHLPFSYSFPSLTPPKHCKLINTRSPTNEHGEMSILNFKVITMIDIFVSISPFSFSTRIHSKYRINLAVPSIISYFCFRSVYWTIKPFRLYLISFCLPPLILDI